MINHQVPLPTPIGQPRVDFIEDRYRLIIEQKGVAVEVEKAIQCACKTSSMNGISDCQNCGGTGWIFVNPIVTRMVLQGMGVSKDQEPWSEAIKGTVRVSCHASQELSYMDRITRLNGISYFSEVLEFKTKLGTSFAYAAYKMTNVSYLGLFMGPTEAFKRLVRDVDFTVERNIIKLLPSVQLPDMDQITASIRYSHAPTFHIMDVTREAVDNFIYDGKKEQVQYLPVSAMARRAHFIADMENLSSNRIINNDFTEDPII